MIRGYVSSDEDDYDDYDFGYSEPLVFNNKSEPSLPEIQTPEIKEKLLSVLEESQRIEAFLKAVDDNDLKTVKELLSQGVSVDCTDKNGWTPLMRTCGEGRFEMVQLLLENGADPNKHRESFTPLMTCCTETLVAEDLKLNCVRLLLSQGAEVNAKDKYRTTALMYAAGSGYENIVSELLRAPGIDVNICNKYGWTALFHAVNHNKKNIVTKLIQAKTNLELKDNYERTALSLALDRNFIKLAKTLGYVEEKPKSKKKKKLNKSLSKMLPNSEGQGGFYEDSWRLMDAFNLKTSKKIGFSDLLNATEKDLHDFGVKLQFDRLKLLCKGIHRYHLCPWKTSSMEEINWGVPLKLEQIIGITACIAKHLTITNASLRYVDTRISSRQNQEPVDMAVEKETIIFLVKSYESVEKINSLLKKIIENIEKIKPDIQGDYIYPYKNEEEKKHGKFFWRAVGAFTAGILIFYYKTNPHFRTLMRFSSYSFSSLQQFAQPVPVKDPYEDLYPFFSN